MGSRTSNLGTERISDTNPIQPLNHIRELDGIRGIAALMVFFHHVCFSTFKIAGWSRPAQVIYKAAGPGAYGVTLFFILSGFLITSILLSDQKKSDYYKAFYWKRVLRILPLYALCLVVIACFYPGSKAFVLLCIFFVSNFASVLRVAALGPFWSLAVEEHFYLIWPALVHRRSPEQVKQWSLWLIILTILARLAFAAVGHYDYHLTFLCCDGLASGAWMACWIRQRKARTNDLPKARSYALCALLVSGALIATGMATSLSVAFASAFIYTGSSILLAAFFFLTLLYQDAPALAVLRAPVLRFFGLISYAFYMFHLFVLDLYDARIGLPLVNDYASYAARLATVLGGTVVLAIASRYLLEQPALSLRKYVLNQAPTRTSGLSVYQ